MNTENECDKANARTGHQHSLDIFICKIYCPAYSKEESLMFL